MLEGMSLSEKLTVAGEWFRRSRTGEFEFTTRHADVFGELLAQCQRDAAVLEAAPVPPPEAIIDNVVALFADAAKGRVEDGAA